MVSGPQSPQGPPPGRPSPLGRPTWPSAPGTPSWPPQRPRTPPPPEDAPPTGGDPFTQAEHATRAAVTSPWWATAAPVQRRQALLPLLLNLPDHSWWLHGAWARWYRWHPADGRWFPSPPPADRDDATPLHPGLTPPLVPAEILPTGPDYAHDHGHPLAVVGRPVPAAIRYRLRSVLTQAAQAPHHDHPLGWNHFLHGTPSTIAATWSTLLWCASVPLVQDHDLLGLWTPHLAQDLDPHGLHWLPPPPLHAILGLYAERLRAARPDAAAQIVRCMVMTAQALRDDPRFRLRASALLSMIEPIQADPALDHRALPYGDQAVEREWRSRCPAPLAAALFPDSAPGERLQLAFYDLATALDPHDHDGDPRHTATALLAADMAAHRPDLAPPVAAWLDPELRALLIDVVNDPTHPLREPARIPFPDSPDTTLAILSAAAALDLSWCRLTGIPVPPAGLPVPTTYAAHLAQLNTKEVPADGVDRRDASD